MVNEEQIEPGKPQVSSSTGCSGKNVKHKTKLILCLLISFNSEGNDVYYQKVENLEQRMYFKAC